MKYKLFLMIFLMSIFLSYAQETPMRQGELMAQNQPPHNGKAPNMQELRDHKWNYIKEKAKLNSEEEKLIRPQFDEYEQKVWKILQANRDAFRQLRGKEKQASDYEKFNEAFVNFDIQKANLQKEFYLKLKKSSSAETIYRFLKADRSFTRELMSKPKQK